MRNQRKRIKPTSYWKPLLKLILSAIVLLLLYCRDGIFPVTKDISTVLTVLTAIAVGPCIIFLVIAFIELAYAIKNSWTKTRNISQKELDQLRVFTRKDLLKLIDACEIVKIKVVSSNRIIKIGASSNWDRHSGRFSNKRYYIDFDEFASLVSFEQALSAQFITNEIQVLSIDGTSPENYTLR